ncbi:EGF_2 domain-containing protein, partial [Durusdinium trenchii]
DGFECQCDDGWTGKSHWVSGEGLDCHINLVTVQLLWAMLLFGTLLVFGFYIVPFVAVYKRFKAQQRVRIAKGHAPRKIWDHKTLLTLAIYFSITTPTFVAMSVLMIARPDSQLLAQDPLPSFLWWVGRSSFYVCTSLYLPALQQSILGRKASKKFWQNGERMAWTLTSGHLVLGAMVWIPFADPDNRRLAVVTWCLAIGLTSVLQAIIALQAWHLKHTLVKQLANAHEYLQNDDIGRTKQLMEELQDNTIRHASAQSFVYLLLSAVPYLHTSYSYILPISWFTIPAMGRRVARTLLIEYQSTNAAGSGFNTIVEDARPDVFSDATELTKGTVLQVEDADDPNLLAQGSQFHRKHGTGASSRSGRSTGRSTGRSGFLPKRLTFGEVKIGSSKTKPKPKSSFLGRTGSMLFPKSFAKTSVASDTEEEDTAPNE